MNESWFEEWVKKAEDDYRTAIALDAADVPAVVCFHSQQCIEKYLKAALVKHKLPTRKTHDLVVLICLVEPKNKEIEGS